MKIITISAKARHGKDYTASLLKNKLEQDGHKVLITHFGDLVKYVCSTFFDWDGKKDEKGRTTLQYVGTDMIRKQRPNYWVDFVLGILEMFPDEWDYVLIPDARFPNENYIFKEKDFDITTLRVVRPNFDNGLTEDQKHHESEVALDNYNFDYTLINNGDETIYNEIGKFLDWLHSEEGQNNE